MTDPINALERARLLGTDRVSEDGRAKRVSITMEGRSVLAHLLPGHFALIADSTAVDPRDAPSTPRG